MNTAKQNFNPISSARVTGMIEPATKGKWSISRFSVGENDDFINFMKSGGSRNNPRILPLQCVTDGL